MSQLIISEIFGPTVQGEGALVGKPTVFVRTGGCDYRCSWCDTLYAVEKKYKAHIGFQGHKSVKFVLNKKLPKIDSNADDHKFIG